MQHDGDGESPGHLDREAAGHGARDRRRAADVATAVFVAVYAWWAVALAPFSGRAAAAIVVAGAVAMAVGARERRGRPPGASDMPGIATWAALAAVAGAWQLAAYLQQPRADHPTVSSLANEVLDSHLARAAAFVAWVAAARGLARR